MISERRLAFFSTWDLLAAGSIAALALFYILVLPALPDPFPTHFNRSGTADGWTRKASLHWLIFGVPVIVWTVFMVIGAAASAMPSDPLKARIASMQPTRGLIVMGMSVVMGACLLIPFFGLITLHAGIGALFACIASAVYFTLRETKELLAGSPEAAHYRWGMFYMNPRDHRLFVEKVCGVGLTLNYARPAAWVITLGLILVAAAVILGLILG